MSLVEPKQQIEDLLSTISIFKSQEHILPMQVKNFNEEFFEIIVFVVDERIQNILRQYYRLFESYEKLGLPLTNDTMSYVETYLDEFLMQLKPPLYKTTKDLAVEALTKLLKYFQELDKLNNDKNLSSQDSVYEARDWCLKNITKQFNVILRGDFKIYKFTEAFRDYKGESDYITSCEALINKIEMFIIDYENSYCHWSRTTHKVSGPFKHDIQTTCNESLITELNSKINFCQFCGKEIIFGETVEALNEKIKKNSL